MARLILNILGKRKWVSHYMGSVFYGWRVVGGAFILLFCATGTQFYAFPVFFDAMIRINTELNELMAKAVVDLKRPPSF